MAGLSYEVIRLAARHAESRIGTMVVAPGLWLQRITTREPDAAQLEVAAAALRAALNMEEQPALAGGAAGLLKGISVN